MLFSKIDAGPETGHDDWGNHVCVVVESTRNVRLDLAHGQHVPINCQRNDPKMDGSRFDQFTKIFASRRLSRRKALGAATATGLLSVAGMRSASAQDAEATPVPEEEGELYPEILFVQGFQSGSFEQIGDSEDQFSLTLAEGIGRTVFFTNRPERDYGAMPTGPFLEGYDFSEENPPNAALVAENADGSDDIIVLELTNPGYDEETNTATYDTRILGDFKEVDGELQEEPAASAADVPQDFTSAHLFIDDCPDGAISCCDIAVEQGIAYCETLHGRISPVGQCFDVGSFFCKPCDSQQRLDERCHETFEACGSKCGAR